MDTNDTIGDATTLAEREAGQRQARRNTMSWRQRENNNSSYQDRKCIRISLEEFFAIRRFEKTQQQ